MPTVAPSPRLADPAALQVASPGGSRSHLAGHPEDQARLAADPSLIPTTVEVFLRANAPATMAREVIAEAEVGDKQVCQEEKVLLTFPAANRDPERFNQPDEVMIDRQKNRHIAFGLGIHRCLGSKLARMELQVALERCLERIPSFRLAPCGDVTGTGGHFSGTRSIPVLFPEATG